MIPEGEVIDSFFDFDALEEEMDWNTPVQEATNELFKELSKGQTGAETIQKVENLMQIAEHQVRFTDIQRIVESLGDVCCTDSVIESVINQSSSSDSTLSTSSTSSATMNRHSHGECHDDHGPASSASNHSKAKSRKSKKTSRHTMPKPVMILPPFWQRLTNPRNVSCYTKEKV